VSIPYGRQLIEADDIEAVVAALESDWLTTGPSVREFEEALAAVCEVPHAVAFSSGTAALHGAAFAAGLGPGDELVTSALTFAASANCGAYLGATPRFADIERETWNLSPRTLEPLLGQGTRAVVPVHFAGLPAPMREIRELVGPDVVLIEDAAHALGARTPEETVGSCRYSDMAVFSFHPVKVVTAGEGGMVTTRDGELAERLRRFRTHGLTKDPDLLSRHDGGWYQEQVDLGFNYRLTDIQSALGRSQLKKLDRFVARRNEIASRYRSSLADVPSLELPPRAPEGSVHAYHLFAVVHREGADARRALFDALHAAGILVQVHYSPVYFHPYYRRTYGYQEGLCPEAERYYAGALSLPCYPALTDEQQETVVRTMRELLSS